MTENEVIEAEQTVTQIKRELAEAERLVSSGYGFGADVLNARVRLKYAQEQLRQIKQKVQPRLF